MPTPILDLGQLTRLLWYVRPQNYENLKYCSDHISSIKSLTGMESKLKVLTTEPLFTNLKTIAPISGKILDLGKDPLNKNLKELGGPRYSNILTLLDPKIFSNLTLLAGPMFSDLAGANFSRLRTLTSDPLFTNITTANFANLKTLSQNPLFSNLRTLGTDPLFTNLKSIDFAALKSLDAASLKYLKDNLLRLQWLTTGTCSPSLVVDRLRMLVSTSAFTGFDGVAHQPALYNLLGKPGSGLRQWFDMTTAKNRDANLFSFSNINYIDAWIEVSLPYLILHGDPKTGTWIQALEGTGRSLATCMSWRVQVFAPDESAFRDAVRAVIRTFYENIITGMRRTYKEGLIDRFDLVNADLNTPALKLFV